MKRKLIVAITVFTMFACSLVGCSYEKEYVPVDTETDTLTDNNSTVDLPNLSQTLPVNGEKFSLVCEYDTGKYSLKKWHVTDAKSINMNVHTKDLPDGYDAIIEHMHADISLVSTSPQINGITQDTMDNSFHGTSQDGFVIDDDTSYYRIFSIEGYTDQFYELWGSAFGNYGSLSSEYKRLTESNIINVGTYAERLSIVYDLAIKSPTDEKYHSVSVKSELLIPISRDVKTKTVNVF